MNTHITSILPAKKDEDLNLHKIDLRESFINQGYNQAIDDCAKAIEKANDEIAKALLTLLNENKICPADKKGEL